MTTSQKTEIKWKLQVYVNKFSSQKKASESLSDVSESTIISILKGSEADWAKISEGMWRNILKQVDSSVDFSRLVETLNFITLYNYFILAKEEGASFSFTGNAGWGKSYTAKWYASTERNNNVYYLECAEYWNKKQFLQNILAQMGKNGAGMSIGDMMETIIREIRRQHQPLIILDEVDKLPDPVLKFFITLYNALNKHCGFVWLSTDAIEKRITRGIAKNAVGYKELYSRVGAKFIRLHKPSMDEVQEICKVNNITSNEEIAKVVNEVLEIGGDLRRVDRNILKTKLRRIAQKNKAA